MTKPTKPNCNGSFSDDEPCGECQLCLEEANMISGKNWTSMCDRHDEARKVLQNCPLCDSNQVRLCLDYNNQLKDKAQCNECQCEAPLVAWNRDRSKS